MLSVIFGGLYSNNFHWCILLYLALILFIFLSFNIVIVHRCAFGLHLGFAYLKICIYLFFDFFWLYPAMFRDKLLALCSQITFGFVLMDHSWWYLEGNKMGLRLTVCKESFLSPVLFLPLTMHIFVHFFWESMFYFLLDITQWWKGHTIWYVNV